MYVRAVPVLCGGGQSGEVRGRSPRDADAAGEGFPWKRHGGWGHGAAEAC